MLQARRAHRMPFIVAAPSSISVGYRELAQSIALPMRWAVRTARSQVERMSQKKDDLSQLTGSVRGNRVLGSLVACVVSVTGYQCKV